MWTHEKEKLDEANKIKLKICDENDLSKVSDATISFYSNPICFADLNELNLKNDWFQKEFSIPFVTINHCNNKKRKCKSKEEALKFLD